MTDAAQFAEQRDRLLAEIEADAKATQRQTGRARPSAVIMAALTKVPREQFVEVQDQGLAYANRPRPIGYGQTISQPFIVALMTELLDLSPRDRVLEVGTGCGYQTAVLAELAAEVYSVEIIPELAEPARQRLVALGYENITIRCGDGRDGWLEQAPYDAVIVTAVAEEIPPALIAQLAVGGRLIAPVGTAKSTQWLVRGIKNSDGEFQQQNVLPVAFVPLV